MARINPRGCSSSVNRFLKEGKYAVSIIDDNEFDKARKCLQAVRKQLTKNLGKERKIHKGS